MSQQSTNNTVQQVGGKCYVMYSFIGLQLYITKLLLFSYQVILLLLLLLKTLPSLLQYAKICLPLHVQIRYAALHI
jgi:hypothetical protein